MPDVNGNAVAKPSYTHAAMVDLIIARPWISQLEIAAHFGYTAAWVSQVLQADSVRELLAARKAELVDPVVVQALEKQLDALMSRSIGVLQEKLGLPNVSADVALKALDISTRARGYGAKVAGTQITQNFVVAMPRKEATGDAWAAAHSPRRLQDLANTVIDVPMSQ